MGLSSEYKEKTDIGKFLIHKFGLPPFMPDMMQDVFVDSMADAPDNARMVQVLAYLMDTYIEDYTHFPQHMWSDMNSSSAQTTNTYKSFHS